MPNGGRPPESLGKQGRALITIVESYLGATMAEVQREFKRCTGAQAHRRRIEKALQETGI